MVMTHLDEEKDRLAFVEKVIENFSINTKHCTYGDLTPGSLFALRYGLGNDCIVIFQISDEEPRNYQNVIPREAD